MKEPLQTRYAPGYDLFKLIVAVILTIILILLLLRESRIKSAELNLTPLPSRTDIATTALATQTPAPGVTETTVSATPTPATTSTATSAPEPSPTESPVPNPPTPNPTPEAASTPDSNACPSNPTRIKVDDRVKTLDWLNFRIGPGLNYPIQHTNRPGTEMDVVGGPTCTVRNEEPPRAYLWWNVRMMDGREGWSAEAPLNFPNYFLEPIR